MEESGSEMMLRRAAGVEEGANEKVAQLLWLGG